MSARALRPPWRPAPDRDQFGIRLYALRTALGLSMEEVAALTGLSRFSWSRWEKGVRPRDWDKVVETICERTGVDRQWLAFGDETVPVVDRGTLFKMQDIEMRCRERSGGKSPSAA